MAGAAMIKTVKSALGITGEYMDDTITVYVDEVMRYLRAAGVKDSVIDRSAGVVARGVADIWNYGAGDGVLSAYFKECAIQLAYESGDDDVSTQ